MADTVVQELVINTLTQAQFDAAKEAGTLSPYELYGTPDTSARLPVLTPMWFDHIANDVSWLRADTFSWQSGDVYVAAYQHLVGDLGTVQKLYCWLGEKTGHKYYTYSESPSVGETTTDGDVITSIDSYGRPVVGAEHLNRNPDGDILSTQTETIGDITITYYLAEDGHKICLPDQESNVSAIYNSTGVAWYYILDTTNRQFKLPRTKWGFTGLRDSVGGYVAPGLPNITGSVQNALNDVALFNQGGTSSSGSLITGARGTSANAGNTGSLTGKFNDQLLLDASRSSSVYGNSTTVQPKATQMYLYFYVGNFTQTALENTAGLNAEMFNDLNAHKVIEFQVPTASNGYTWYRKYADGWVEQGGIYSITGVTFANFNLIVPMADSNYTATGNSAGTTTNAFPLNFNRSAFTTTTFSAKTGNAGTGDFYWQVCGMAA